MGRIKAEKNSREKRVERIKIGEPNRRRAEEGGLWVVN